MSKHFNVKIHFWVGQFSDSIKYYAYIHALRKNCSSSIPAHTFLTHFFLCLLHKQVLQSGYCNGCHSWRHLLSMHEFSWKEGDIYIVAFSLCIVGLGFLVWFLSSWYPTHDKIIIKYYYACQLGAGSVCSIQWSNIYCAAAWWCF